MNVYTIDTIQVGDSASFTTRVTPEWFSQFYAHAGDDNPLHMDETFAKKEGYRGRVLYGMCTASLYSTLAGVYLPGKYCLLLECDAKFIAPVFEGDELTVTGTVQEKDERFQRVVVKADIRNQNGEKVSRAKIVAGFLNDQTI